MEKRKNGQSGAKSFAVCEPLSLLLRLGGRICINYEAHNVGPLDAQPMGGSSFSSNEKVESGANQVGSVIIRGASAQKPLGC